MLELQHICYDVEQDGEDKGILRDIDLTIDERFVAITGPNGGGKSPWPRSSPASTPPPAGGSCWTGRTSPAWTSPSGPTGASALPFSSRCASRV